jgi:tetratricopeptide (TPR) repeat protein
LNELARLHQERNETTEAEETFRRGVEVLSKLAEEFSDAKYQRETARIRLELADLLRIAERAVEAREMNIAALAAAEAAIAAAPNVGEYWHTLGIARFRNDDWEGAVAAFQEAVRRGSGGGDGLFMVAMALWRLDDHGEARHWYDRAVEWMEGHPDAAPSFEHIRQEATELLQIAPAPDQASPDSNPIESSSSSS